MWPTFWRRSGITESTRLTKAGLTAQRKGRQLVADIRRMRNFK